MFGRRREILMGVSGEDFPAFFPRTAIAFSAARNKTLNLLSPRASACARPLVYFIETT